MSYSPEDHREFDFADMSIIQALGRSSVVKRIFEFPEFFGADSVPDLGCQLLQLGQISGGFDRQIEQKAAQAQCCNEPCGYRVSI